MIKEASGTTTGGAPINLTETKYDDVYGRMEMLKFGVGYRTTPRAEGVFNFIISRSSSQTVRCRHGGLRRQLAVDFTDYNYWGIEGGQRFFFARTRFTPYLGYLVGVNRYNDIEHVRLRSGADARPRGTRREVLREGLVVQFRPHGGIPHWRGPFEIMAETQLRFMGGLSDVDWLVEEGLRTSTARARGGRPVHDRREIRF